MATPGPEPALVEGNMDVLTTDEERELYNMFKYYQIRVLERPNGGKYLKYDNMKLSALQKALDLNAFVKGVINEQDNQGLPETSGSGGSGDAD